MTLESVAQQVYTYRVAFPQFYGTACLVSSIMSQVYHCSGRTFDARQCVESAHLAMKKLAGKVRFLTRDHKPYDPFTRNLMIVVPNKWVALAPLLK